MKTAQDKQQPRKWFRIIHLWLGLISGLVVFVVSVTGALYVFEEEGRALFQPHYYHTPAPSGSRLSVDQLKDTVEKHFPGEKISSIRFKGAADAAWIFYTPDRFISVDPANGTILGVREKGTDFFTVVLKIHMELYLGDVGKEIIKWNVLVFFLLCLTGLILWWPRKIKYFRHAVKISLKTRNRKLLIWNLHTVFGFYALLILLLVAFTGMFWAFDTVKSLSAVITTGNARIKEYKYKIPVAQGAAHFSLEKAWGYASGFGMAEPVETIITPADKKNAAVRVTIRYPFQLVREQNSFYFNANTGALLAQNLYGNYSAYDKVAMSNFNLHTGRIPALGLGSKLIYFLAALVAASLPVTGFLMWWGKQQKKKKRRRKPAAAPAAA